MTTLSFPSATPWLNVGAKLCECPRWDARTDTLHWVDIPAGHLYAHSWGSTQAPRRLHEGPGPIGGFTLQRDGSFLLFRQNDIARLQPGGGEPEVIVPFVHDGSTRFNDVLADPHGRVFAGTIGATPTSGGLFRIDLDGTVTQVASGTGIANGITFSPDLKLLYWVCSTRRTIFAFPYDQATGQLGEPTPFFQGSEEDGYPDGLTSDREGNLYSVRWAAKEYGLYVFNPEGKILHRQKLPAVATSAGCFFGPDLTDFAITSAEDLANDPDRPADLFRMERMPIAGKPDFHSAIGL
ncbi:MAG TPA: SMP-30/gluconolactonase/LRE family protein [Chthoniobacteraceae bacterium]|nr:SMP-30/gluconolactonase/LRE family protein [Chthoniobacteraceae bacterium]